MLTELVPWPHYVRYALVPTTLAKLWRISALPLLMSNLDIILRFFAKVRLREAASYKHCFQSATACCWTTNRYELSSHYRYRIPSLMCAIWYMDFDRDGVSLIQYGSTHKTGGLKVQPPARSVLTGLGFYSAYIIRSPLLWFNPRSVPMAGLRILARIYSRRNTIKKCLRRIKFRHNQGWAVLS